jgi:monoamine oxidase
VRVIVVGAGFAGLAAADALVRAGADVEVLEARDRVGGRVWSMPFAGATAERGAEFILPGNDTVIAMAERLGLRLVRKGTHYGDREPRGGLSVSPADVAVVARQIAAAPLPAGAVTLADALRRHELDPGVAQAIQARIEVSCGHPAEDLAADALSEGAAVFGEFDSWTVEGGNDRIAKELAAQLGSALHLSSPVVRVAWSDAAVKVVAGDGPEVVADAAVLAVPATVLSSILFEPPLPPDKVAALTGVRYGQAAKLFVPLNTPVPPSATLSVPERFWCYTQLGADGEPLPFVSAFAGTPDALDALEVGRGPERWLASLERLRPDLELDAAGAAIATWADDRWARGAYSARSAASPMDTEALVRPVGALQFAAEHTAGEWHGLMDGALRSGVRAAQQLLHAAGR